MSKEITKELAMALVEKFSNCLALLYAEAGIPFPEKFYEETEAKRLIESLRKGK